MENEVKNLKENNSKEHNALSIKIDDFIESADKKYAPRWIMTLFSWIAGIMAVVISAGTIKYLW